MAHSAYLPAGADHDPAAPYNQASPRPHTYDVQLRQYPDDPELPIFDCFVTVEVSHHDGIDPFDLQDLILSKVDTSHYCDYELIRYDEI